MRAADLAGASRAELMDRMLAGHPIAPADLEGADYRGVSLGLPAALERLSWKTFVKAFRRDPDTGRLGGWNVRIDQGRPEDYRPRLRRGRPVTFGHFVVQPARGYRMPRPCDQGLVLDYGLGRRRRLSPLAALRDPIVALEPGSAELLLGWSYLDIAGRQIPTPSFFTLERAPS
jgi:hypothetical protein